MTSHHSRRNFLKTTAAGIGASFVVPRMGIQGLGLQAAEKETLYRISLAEWSLHKMLFDNKLKNMDFAKYSKEQFGIEAIEYVNQFFKDKAKDKNYLAQLKQTGGGSRRQVTADHDRW